MRNTLLYSVLLLLIFSGCKPSDGNYTPINPELKAYVNWRQGSYWIMQDSATGQIDSFYVESYDSSLHISVNDGTNEELDIQIREVCISSITNDTSYWYVNIGGLGNPQDDEIGVFWDSNKSYKSGLYFTGFFNSGYPEITRNFCGVSYQQTHISETGDVFPNPTTFLLMATQYNNGFLYIKSNYKTYNHTWCLLRSNIVRK